MLRVQMLPAFTESSLRLGADGVRSMHCHGSPLSNLTLGADALLQWAEVEEGLVIDHPPAGQPRLRLDVYGGGHF